MKNSLTEFGCVEPLVIRKEGMEIIGGHQRFFAAKEMGWESLPCILLKIEADRAKVLNISLNKIHGEWDIDKLQTVIEEIKAGPLDISLTGFDDISLDELGLIEKPEGLTDPDDVPEPPKKAVTKTGDLYLLGDHRLLCGDSTKTKDVERLMDGEKMHAILTDPPYGVGVDYGDFDDTLENVAKLISQFMPLLLSFDVPMLLTSGHKAMWLYPQPSWVLAWVHPAGIGRNPWGFTQFNPVLAYGSDPYLSRGLGFRPDALVLAADREGETGHPTPKPIKVWIWLVERVSPAKNELIFDPFLGSGTTIIACEKLSRRCYGMEIDPLYCDVIVKRWEEFTGKKAKRA